MPSGNSPALQSNLKSVFVVVIPGAHLVRDPVMPKATTDQELRDMGWFEGKAHPVTGAALEMVALDLPPGTGTQARRRRTFPESCERLLTV